MEHAASPWRTTSEAVLFEAWSDRQLAVLQSTFEHLCASWVRDWGVKLAGGRIEPLGSGGVSPAGWVACGDAERSAHIWIPQWPAGRCAHERLAFGIAATPVTQEIVRRCRADFERRLSEGFGVAASRTPCESLPRVVFEPWSGALQLAVATDLFFVADAAAIRHWLSKQGEVARSRPGGGKLCAVHQAIEGMTLDFDLELTGCEVDASTLLTLEPGDVVCLPHALDVPAQLRDADGRRCFAGDMRQQSGKKAVQLCSVPIDRHGAGGNDVRRS